MIKWEKMKNVRGLVLAGLMLTVLLYGGVYAFSSPPNDQKVTQVVTKEVSKFESPVTDIDWPMFRGNESRSGYSSAQFIAPPLSVKWAYATSGNVWSSPAVMAGTLFVGSSDGKLYSIDIAEGNMRWAYKTSNAIFSSPAVNQGTVYFGSTDHNFYALDADTGTLKWMYETSDPITSSPVVQGGVVYFGSWDGYLYALNSSGSEKWKVKTDGAIYSSPSISRGKVFVGSSDGKVYAVDLKEEKVLWTFQTEDYVSATPLVSGKVVYVGSWDGNMYAISADKGELIWKFRTGGGIYSSAALSDDNIIFGSYDGKLYCLDKAKGMLKWEYLAKDSVYHSSPVVANGIVYVGLGYKNKIQAFNAKTGEFVWGYPTGASVGSSPAISGTNMYIAASDGKIYAFGDISAPEAIIKPLETAYNRYNFIVSWSGADTGGSGIRSYDIQFRTGAGEPWQNWLTDVATTFAQFGPKEPVAVKDNTVYYFQARATDNSGNVGAFAGGDGDTYTVIDLTPPRIAKVSFNNVTVQPGSFIQSKPLIQVSISDNVAVDPESLKVLIDNVEYKPDSFANGLLKYKHKAPLLPGKHDIKVVASDISGNKADSWEIKGLRVSEGIEAADISTFPTPFNPIAGPVYLSYRLNANAEASIFIYDKYGSLVYSMKINEGDNGGKRGWNKVLWSGVTGSNSIVGNGEYSFKIVANRNLVGRGQIVVQK